MDRRLRVVTTASEWKRFLSLNITAGLEEAISLCSLYSAVFIGAEFSNQKINAAGTRVCTLECTDYRSVFPPLPVPTFLGVFLQFAR